jgi:hypothetical protein
MRIRAPVFISCKKEHYKYTITLISIVKIKKLLENLGKHKRGNIK